MGIKSKLALVFVLAGALLLAFVAIDRQRLDKRTLQFQQDLAAEKARAFDTVFELIRASYHNYVVDMTFWDESVAFVSEPDESWAGPNIDSSAETFGVDFILVFNRERQVVYTYTDEASPILAAQVKGIVDWQAVFQGGERFCNYHLQLGAKLYEIDGATIHPTADPERLTAPQGYFLVGKQYDRDFLAEIAAATGSEIELSLRGFNKAAEKRNHIEGSMVHISRPLMNAAGRPLATLMASYNDASLTSFVEFIQRHFFTMAGFFAAAGLVVVLLASYWLQKPLAKISSALAKEDLEALESHGRSYAEFSHICGMLGEGMKHHFAIEREVQERIHAEKKLSEARDEAERANRAKSEFLANMSHEIRTPMNAVLGFTELTKAKVSDPEVRDYLGHIEYGGKIMLSLIDDILDMSKIEAGKMTLHPKAADLQRTVAELVGVFSLNAEQKGLVLKSQLPEEPLPMVKIDHAKFRQIMVNLIGNALKFTHEGSIEVALRWSRSDEACAQVEVSVTDTGIGIAADQKRRIFTTFMQQHGQDSVEYGGTGLGLSLSRNLARLMGGDITVESQLGEGSCFSVVLPKIPLAESGSEADPTVLPAASAEALKDKRILIAEDDVTNQTLLRICLEQVGAAVVLAKDGEAAWKLLDKESFDLVLSDMQMPVLGGMGLLERVKQTEKTASLPFVLMTATFTSQDQAKAAELGCISYVSKPISLGEVRRICAEALKSAKVGS